MINRREVISMLGSLLNIDALIPEIPLPSTASNALFEQMIECLYMGNMEHFPQLESLTIDAAKKLQRFFKNPGQTEEMKQILADHSGVHDTIKLNIHPAFAYLKQARTHGEITPHDIDIACQYVIRGLIQATGPDAENDDALRAIIRLDEVVTKAMGWNPGSCNPAQPMPAPVNAKSQANANSEALIQKDTATPDALVMADPEMAPWLIRARVAAEQKKNGRKV